MQTQEEANDRAMYRENTNAPPEQPAAAARTSPAKKPDESNIQDLIFGQLGGVDDYLAQKLKEMENYSDPEEDEAPAQHQEAADPHQINQAADSSQQQQHKQDLHTAGDSQPADQEGR